MPADTATPGLFPILYIGMRYKITVEFDSDYIPSDIMESLKGFMAIQLESLHDGTLPTEDIEVDYRNVESEWFCKTG